jgi:hypothetical protein
MAERFQLRRASDNDSWAIIDIFTDLPVEIEEMRLVGMEMGEAEDMADLMNMADRKRRALVG